MMNSMMMKSLFAMSIVIPTLSSSPLVLGFSQLSIIGGWMTVAAPSSIHTRSSSSTRPSTHTTTTKSAAATTAMPRKALLLSTTTEAVPFAKGPRIIRPELPTLYVYDHCPFCVRVRLALGVKNVKHLLHFLANDDVYTPTKLVGKKIAPIFSLPEDGSIMAESLDIIAKLDSDARFGPINRILPSSCRKDIQQWQKSTQDLLRILQRPRYVATGLLPEFQQLDGRHAFVKNHLLPPYEKSEWKGSSSTGASSISGGGGGGGSGNSGGGDSSDTPPPPLGLDMSVKLKLYAEAMASDPAPLIEDLNARLVELDDMLYSDRHCSDCGGFSLDDIDLWSRLRSVTIVKGVSWPAKLRRYMDNISALGDVPLYDDMAL